METENLSAMSDNLRRLATFQQYPPPEQGGRNRASLLCYNSPLKQAKAGFYRYPEAPGDEVRCYRCSVSYRGWTGESPMAVHRILSPDCPHVLSLTPERLTGCAARGGSSRVRRRLQMGSPTPNQASDDVTNVAASQQSVLDVYDRFQTPVTADQSDTESEGETAGSMFFESHRLLTFPSPTHPLTEEWAASGFVHEGEGGVVRCVFCGVELQYDVDQPAKMHKEQSQNCPLVKLLDVGNIPRDLENRVRSKHLELSDGSREACSNYNPLFKHPQFEEIQSRLETYKFWPQTIPFTANSLAQVGFYYSGYSDKVSCFACGYSLRNWNPEADPWTQHARHALHCVFVIQEKGDSFISDAQDAQVMTDCDTPEDSNCSSSLHTSSPLRPSLDMAAITAALACQYDVQQIRHAILKFFLSSRGHYPNEALLLGTLRSSDVNFSQLQRQREQLHTKNLSIIRQAEQIQQVHQELGKTLEELGRQGEVLQENQSELEREQTQHRMRERQLQMELAQEKSLVQSQAQVIQSHSHQLQTTFIQLQEKTDQLREQANQGGELERKQRELDRHAEENRRQAEEMRRQAEENQRLAEKMQRLQQLLQANNIVDNEADDAGNNNLNNQVAPADPSSSYTRCKVCLEEDARCVFRPCRHMCCGTQCAPRFVGRTCPICRDRVHDWEIIYVA